MGIVGPASASLIGSPNLRHGGHIIVGSSVSRELLATTYRIPRNRITTLPYPIDLEFFRPLDCASRLRELAEPVRLLWLGRIIPRKRLDVFLDGAATAIRSGLDLKVTVAGKVGFVKGYDKLIRDFSFPERLQWLSSLRRAEIPALFAAHDILAQPSEEENFGSSVG